MANILNFKKRIIENLPDDLIKISDFALKYKCDKSYPYKLRDRGKLRFYKIGTYKISESAALRAMGSC